MPSLRFLFVVQGEGRGHMTQALALRRLLARAGHRLSGVVLTRSARRTAPAFFLDKVGAPVTRIDSPNFVADDRHRGVHAWATFLRGLRFLAGSRASLRTVAEAMERHRPDVVVNFFEPVTGLHYLLRRPRVPMVCVGHQYLLLHPRYPFPPGARVHRRATQAFIRLTSAGATRRLALSLYPGAPAPTKRLDVVPPLLREAVFDLPLGMQQDFVLVYLLNSGYAEELIAWHRRRPEVPLHCFWDRPGAAPVERRDATLTFHQIDDVRFLERMARCRGLACTAGFESVAEAMYLGKPVHVVPVEGHYEQRCNARDAERVVAGARAATFDLDRLMALPPRSDAATAAYRAWLATAETRILGAIEAAAGFARPTISMPPPGAPAAPSAPATPPGDAPSGGDGAATHRVGRALANS